MNCPKRRRSNRIEQAERVLLHLETSGALKEVVMSVNISQQGVKVLARRRMAPNSRGTALRLSAGREAPCRIVRQDPPGAEGLMETGLEIDTPNTSYWGFSAWQSEIEPEPAPAPVVADVPAAPPSLPELLEPLRAQAGEESFSVQLLCGIVDALEAKGLFTRDELIGTLRKLGR